MRKVFIALLFLAFSWKMLPAQEEQPILIIVDMQEAFTQHQMDSVVSQRLIKNINNFISGWRPEEVIFIQAHIQTLNISFKGIKVETEENLKLDGRLNRKKIDPVFMKEESSALTVSELSAYLESNQIDHLYLAGIYLGECLSATAIDAKEKGYRVTVIREAVTAKKTRKSEKMLRKLEKHGVEVI